MPLIRRVTDPNQFSPIRRLIRPTEIRPKFRLPPGPKFIVKQTFADDGTKVSMADTFRSDDENTQRLLSNIMTDAQKLGDPSMRQLWLDAATTFAKNGGDVSGLIEVAKWRRSCVPINEFILGDAYLGIERNEIFPAVYTLLHELDSDAYNECVLGGALGIGKTFAANLMTARAIYKISCMRHPQSSFGLQARSLIVFTIQSVRLTTAKKAVFEELGQYIRNSPYFQNIYPYDRFLQSQMLFREQRITVMPVSSSPTGVISMNVIGGQLDEANFFQRIAKSKSSEAEADGSLDQAKRLYDTLARRRKSRFVSRRVPGIFFVISSAKFPDDFTSRKAAEAKMNGGPDAGIYTWLKSQWEVKPPSEFRIARALEADGKVGTFKVQIGNDFVRSKVLDENEEAHALCESVDVPMDFQSEFLKDPDGALRDFAGVTSRALRPFMPNRDKVLECMTLGEQERYVNPFQYTTYDLSLGIPEPDRRLMRTDITTPRACHIDLGLRRDAAGLAIGHVVGVKMVERHLQGTTRIELAILPVVAYDVILRIIPPPGGEIEFSMIRRLVKDLRDVYHLPIKYVTFDGFESVDSRQILKAQGFLTDYLSVEGLEAYNSLKEGIYDERVLLHRNQFLAGELAGLQYSLNRSGNKETVDHRPEGTKDVADGVCGVYSFLMNRKASWRDVGVFNRTVIQVPETVEDGVQIIRGGDGVPQRRIMTRPNPVRSDPARANPARR